MKIFTSLFFFLFSSLVLAGEDLTGKKILCAKFFWGFEFISSEKILVISTNINSVTNIREYYYNTVYDLPYVNLYSDLNSERNAIFSLNRKTLRIDRWTMTSGGITPREIIPGRFCEVVKIDNLVDYIEELKNNKIIE